MVVPEDDLRLTALRIGLKRLHDLRGAILLPTHDQLAIEAAGISVYGAG
jgi:hypothetical protein